MASWASWGIRASEMNRVGLRSGPGRRASISDSWMLVFSEKLTHVRVMAGDDGLYLKAIREGIVVLSLTEAPVNAVVGMTLLLETLLSLFQQRTSARGTRRRYSMLV